MIEIPVVLRCDKPGCSAMLLSNMTTKPTFTPLDYAQAMYELRRIITSAKWAFDGLEVHCPKHRMP